MSARYPLCFKRAILLRDPHARLSPTARRRVGRLVRADESAGLPAVARVDCIWLLPMVDSRWRDGRLRHPPTLRDPSGLRRSRTSRRYPGAPSAACVSSRTGHEPQRRANHPWSARAQRAGRLARTADCVRLVRQEDKYQDARIIFTDTEDVENGPGTRSPAVYWQRFFSHQPDLNYDNPGPSTKAMMGRAAVLAIAAWTAFARRGALPPIARGHQR